MRICPPHRTRTSRSSSGWAQEARASASSRESAASGDLSSCAAAGANPASNTPTVTQTNHAARMSEERAGSADLDDVHLREGVRSVAMDRSAVFGAQHALGHQLELLIGNVNRRGRGHAQLEAK